MSAADGAAKKRPEWPPHPDRLFMALAAAWFETGTDEREGQSLRWLESLPPPEILASEYSERSGVVSYVPTNDALTRSTPPTKNTLKHLRESGLGLIPEHRSRQARSFPVAIPFDSTVSYLWRNHGNSEHFDLLQELATKVTHIGHSASFVQVWLEKQANCESTWVPADSIATHRFRVPSEGSLDRLAERFNRDRCVAYRDLLYELDQAKAELKAIKHPPRAAWHEFPDVVLLADEKQVKHHDQYSGAKSGAWLAAKGLVKEFVSMSGIRRVAEIVTSSQACSPILVAAHAREDTGFNAIPAALSFLLAEALDLSYDESIVQTNVVQHTGADGYTRLARQAAFAGNVRPNQAYLLVDDFVGQGGTLANLRGQIEKQGGRVIGAVALTGKPFSAKLDPSKEQINELKSKHGQELERWWKERFGHAFDCLTQSEARYLANSPNVDTIRDRITASMRQGGVPGVARSRRELRSRIDDLTQAKARRFPNGEPAAPKRPMPLKWQGYIRPNPESRRSAAAESTFDSRLLILTLKGRRMFLPTTLKLSAALRGLLLKECSSYLDSVPEWISGHAIDGGPSTSPHIALVPLPFVGADHSDGRILGMAMALPRGLSTEEAGNHLEPAIRDLTTHLPREDLRIFDGSWLECGLELETRAHPPYNLRPDTWTRESRIWASVTPVVLNRHFDGPGRWEHASENAKDACEHIGLPRPDQCLLHPVSRVQGVPHSRSFPQITRKLDGGRQSHCHAVLVFNHSVRGPVMIGAGRFRGYGFFRPMREQSHILAENSNMPSHEMSD